MGALIIIGWFFTRWFAMFFGMILMFWMANLVISGFDFKDTFGAPKNPEERRKAKDAVGTVLSITFLASFLSFF